MIAYAESSAVLAWILAEPNGEPVRNALAGAEHVVSSTLTYLECHRAIRRGARDGRLGPGDELAALQLLDQSRATWVTLEMHGAVLEHAAGAFPHEPVRTLDAIHLATALEFRTAFPDLAVVSLDDRVRTNASELGLSVVP